MKKNGAVTDEKFHLIVHLSADELADLRALATILGISVGELGTRALRNELKATDAAPTVQAAITAVRSAREAIRRKQAVKEAKA